MTGLDDNGLPPAADAHTIMPRDPDPRWAVVLQDVKREELEGELARVLAGEKFAHVDGELRVQAAVAARDLAAGVPGEGALHVRIASSPDGTDYSVEVEAARA